MIRAVFFDIDGTLVSLKTKRCPDSTKAAIRALREKGIRVYVASGRSRFELEEQEMLRGMTFDGYLTNNGQIVYDGSWNLLRTVAMVPDEVRALVDYCDERSLPLWLVSEQRSRFNYHFNDRVPVVVYGAREPNFGSCGSVLNLFEERYGHHPAIYGGVLADDCADVLRAFFSGLRET